MHMHIMQICKKKYVWRFWLSIYWCEFWCYRSWNNLIP